MEDNDDRQSLLPVKPSYEVEYRSPGGQCRDAMSVRRAGAPSVPGQGPRAINASWTSPALISDMSASLRCTIPVNSIALSAIKAVLAGLSKNCNLCNRVSCPGGQTLLPSWEVKEWSGKQLRSTVRHRLHSSRSYRRLRGRTSPLVIFTRRVIALSIVVLPEPFGPIIPKNCPLLTDRLMSLSISFFAVSACQAL